MAIAYSNGGQEWSPEFSGDQIGLVGALNPDSGSRDFSVVGDQGQAGNWYTTLGQQSNTPNILGYDTNTYTGPNAAANAWLDSYGTGPTAGWGKGTAGLSQMVSKFGLDPNKIIQGISNSGIDPQWFSGPEWTLETVLGKNPGLGNDATNAFFSRPDVQTNINADTQNSSNHYDRNHPRQSMTGSDYAQILASVASMAAPALMGAGGMFGGDVVGPWTSGYDIGTGASSPWASGYDVAGGGTGGMGGDPGWSGGYDLNGGGSLSPQGNPASGATDGIQGIDQALQRTGADTATGAANAGGFSSPEQMLGNTNPDLVNSGAPSNPSGLGTGQPTPAPASTPSPTLSKMLSNLGNGVTPEDIFNYIKANPTSLLSPMGGGPVSNALSLGNSLYGLYSGNQQKKALQSAAAGADPFSAYRAQYAQQLQQLMANPSSISSTPGYQAGIDAITRKMAGQGYLGSGNMMAALANYGQNAFNTQVQSLGQLAGAGANPAGPGTILASGSNVGNQQIERALAALGYGTRLFGI